jgi:hypothetical protein
MIAERAKQEDLEKEVQEFSDNVQQKTKKRESKGK